MHQLQDAYVFGNNAFKVRDKRLKLLEGKETIDTLKNIKDRWNKYEDKDFTITVAVTHSKGKQSYDNLIVRHEGGGIGSEGNIILNLKDSKNGEMKLIGQTLKGKQIYINTYNIAIDAGKTETHTNEINHNETIEVGGEIGKSGTFMPTIGYNEAKGQTEEQHISYTPTVINGDHITIKAGGNIHIKGSQIAGKKINIEAKKNLTIESNQESYTYKNKNAGIGINVGVKTVSGEITKGKINYQLDTVTEQAGIYAGDEGFTINVGEATNLKGAIIDSQAKDENKNTLTTNSIHTENIINEESLSNQDIGAGYHEGEGTKRNEEKLTPMIPISIDKNKKSITYAGIQKGKLIIKGNQNYSVDKVNRNTQDTLNALESTLDLKDIEEKKRLSELFAKYANGYIHDISKEKGWKEGSEEKVILHTIIGGITAKIGNGNYQAGALSGAVNELMNGAIAKYEAKTGKPIDPATHQWLSAAVGAIVNQAAGMSMQTGAAEAVYGTKWNLQAKDTDDVYIVIYDALEKEHKVGHTAFLVGNEVDGYTEVGFATTYGILFNPDGEEVRRDMEGVIDEKYYSDFSGIKKATLFKLKLSEKEKGQLIDYVNFYQGNNERVETPVYIPDHNFEPNNPYWRYSVINNNCNEFVMRILTQVLPVDDDRRKGVNFYQFVPALQRKSLVNSRLVTEVIRQ